MSTDSRIDSDLKALADTTSRGLPPLDHTARALRQAQAERGGLSPMKTNRKPLIAVTLGLALVAAVLLVPIPYTHVTGYDLTVRGADGRVAVMHLPTRSKAQAERRAAAVRKHGAEVTVAPRTERTWGSVYAMAKDKLIKIDVDMDGKTDAQVEDEIRAQLADSGWTPSDVKVTRDENGATVHIGADDGAGRQIQIVGRTDGEGTHVQVQAGDIDDTREPGMTDEQLRQKILNQFKAKGMDADVTVEGDKIEIRAHRQAP